MSDITSEEIENQFIIFSEAKKRFIEELENGITELHKILKNKFRACADLKKAKDLHCLLAFDFDMIDYINTFNKKFFIIESLNKLDKVIEIKKIRDNTGKLKAPQIIQYTNHKDYKNNKFHWEMTKKEIEKINNINLTPHWSDTEKIKYSSMQKIAETISKNEYKEFYDLLYSILKNKELTEKYTRLIFKKAPKHKTKEELNQKP